MHKHECRGEGSEWVRREVSAESSFMGVEAEEKGL